MSIDKYDQALKQALDGMNVPMDLHASSRRTFKQSARSSPERRSPTSS